jgi:hypothetical protein
VALLLLFILLPFLNIFITLFSYMYIKYFDHIHPPTLPSPFAFPHSCWFPHLKSPVYTLNSTYEKEHIFIFLSLAYFAKYDDLQFHSTSNKWRNFILLYDWIVPHYIKINNTYTPIYTHIHISFFLIHSLVVYLGWFHS